MSATATLEITRQTPYDTLPAWLTVQETARWLGCNPWLIYEHVHSGKIPHQRFGEKFILIPKTYLDPAKASQQVTA